MSELGTKSPRISPRSPAEKITAPLANVHPSLGRQRQSVSSIQVRGLFGLGGPELAIIAIVGAFVIGPENLGKMAGQFKSGLDDVPDELKKIPEEFQKGVEEGETNARARNAKQMESFPELEGTESKDREK